MKHSAHIATLSAVLALACASQAEAARGIRTDTSAGNLGWQTCSAVNICTWSDDLLFNPVGELPADPSLDFSTWSALVLDGVPGPELNGDGEPRPDAGVNAARNELQQGISASAPGLSLKKDDAQVVFFDFSGLAPGELQDLIAPNGDNLFVPNPVTSEAWEVEFNYLTEDVFDDDGNVIGVAYTNLPAFASFQWGEQVYTADASVLRQSSNAFVYYNGFLNAATGWTPVPINGVPEPGTLGLLIGALGLGIALRRQRKGAPLLQSA